ncbi:MAG: hypothetical protein WBO37_03110 [Gammaproteobacteria bacterium]
MEMLYFTLAAIFLYLFSDWILNQLEIRRGERFEHRTLIFFAIILLLSLVLFQLIQRLYPTPGPGDAVDAERIEQGAGAERQ